MAEWRSRIVGHADVAPAELVANPLNWRLHPKTQTEAIGGTLNEIGWVAEVIVNQTTGHIVDGHARVQLALDRKEPTVPVVYVALTEEEERLALLTFDPLADSAVKDQQMVVDMLSGLEVVDDHLRRLLESQSGQEQWIKPTELSQDAIDKREAALKAHYEELHKAREFVPITCPNCHGSFSVQRSALQATYEVKP